VRHVSIRIVTKAAPTELCRGQAHVDGAAGQLSRLLGDAPKDEACVCAETAAMYIAQLVRKPAYSALPPQVPERKIRAADGMQSGASTSITVRKVVHTFP